MTVRLTSFIAIGSSLTIRPKAVWLPLGLPRRLESGFASPAVGRHGRPYFRSLDRATPSRSRVRRVKNTINAISRGGIGGSTTAYIL